MLTDWYYGGGRIVIDTCPDCRLVWLDAGELQPLDVADARDPQGGRRPSRITRSMPSRAAGPLAAITAAMPQKMLPMSS